ncbi:hypothetical protein D9613_001512 [Agrocybe pediades]|uniref:Protein kinase domain-containing protein n=1 Tax=Agrocybe pediades TaxID=84607 RepID=A0A8H4R8M3_9AGAR|nr:hypothetical protein D9613_001512 [Agrocybe pediades]
MTKHSESLQVAIKKALEANFDPDIEYEELMPMQGQDKSRSDKEESDSDEEESDSDEDESDSDEESTAEKKEVVSAPPNGPPYTFYDRHIASSLLLKQVVYLPSMVRSFSNNLEAPIRDILNTRMIRAESIFPRSLDVNMGWFYDAYDVAKYYTDNVGGFCALLASTLFFLPTRDDWKALLLWNRSSERSFSNEVGLHVAQNENGGLYIPELEEHFSESVKKTIADLHAQSPRLAIWDFFPMSEPCLSMLQSMTQGCKFDWEISQTRGHKTTSYILPKVDANSFNPLPSSKRSASRASRPKLKHGRSTTRKSKYIVPAKTKNLSRYRISLKHYLQKAWAKSVIDDTTFFILNCGRYERIGFRHRGTQTLYLSGVIDTVNIQKPRYRKLHLGLLIEIVKDALRRLELTKLSVNNKEAKSVQGAKRPLNSSDAEERETKRRKYEVEPSNRYLSEGKKEVANRNLLLVELDYDVYCSPAPSTFLRIGPACVSRPAAAKGHSQSRPMPRFPVKSRCEAHEYALLTLAKPIGSGAVGVAHPAFLTLKLKSGDTLEASLVLKLAFTAEQKAGLRNEYRIYSRLAERSIVNGILTVYDLFSDPESGTLGLLMDYGGESLYSRSKRLGIDMSEILSPAQKTSFQECLQDIHEARIRHGDIRPNNMLLHPNGSVLIIDFDRGSDVYEPVGNCRRDSPMEERRKLNDILTGQYLSP